MRPSHFLTTALLAIALGSQHGTVSAQSKPSTKPATAPSATAPPPPPPAPPEPPPAACGAIAGAIEDALKEIAYNSVSGLLDNSAPRETNRQLRIAAGWQSIHVQLLHGAHLKCPSPQRPLTWDAYKRSAVKCYTDEREGKFRESCERAKWVRDEDLPPPGP